ncbi:uncharacterized membrane protein YcaP (DUF421 family) [Natronobacillus azotifigens]|uniref:Uncharacterized protein n=1 Tax=Natronobacillus azotifigens TaxID=472978 RepID=A0A9J6RBP3_9BACI|nr:hypothetical protein [Natronobacillus azotifigens]MCZ0702774.1 hypothetical protein [Natronobacillus azotifigens]
MRTAFLQLFFGYLIVLIGIDVGGFDLLFDPIGYLLIAAGLVKLAQRYDYADTAYRLAFFLAFFGIIHVIVPIFLGSIPFLFFGVDLFDLIISILKLLLVYFIFQLLLQYSERKQDFQLRASTGALQKMYFIFALASIILSPVFLIAFPFAPIGLIILIFVLGYAVVEVIFLVWLFKYSRLEG